MRETRRAGEEECGRCEGWPLRSACLREGDTASVGQHGLDRLQGFGFCLVAAGHVDTQPRLRPGTTERRRCRRSRRGSTTRRRRSRHAPLVGTGAIPTTRAVVPSASSVTSSPIEAPMSLAVFGPSATSPGRTGPRPDVRVSPVDGVVSSPVGRMASTSVPIPPTDDANRPNSAVSAPGRPPRCGRPIRDRGRQAGRTWLT